MLIEFAISSYNSKNDIEFGCGTGYWLECLNVMGVDNIVGIDFSDGMLNIARKRCEFYTNTEIIKLLLPDEYNPTEKFDLILSLFFISSFWLVKRPLILIS